MPPDACPTNGFPKNRPSPDFALRKRKTPLIGPLVCNRLRKESRQRLPILRGNADLSMFSQGEWQ